MLIPTIRPTKKQHEAWEALKTKDVVFLGGGAGGGKSWWLCETRLVNSYFYPGYRSFIGREELKRLMQSTFITWSKVCQWHKIPKDDWKLNGQYNFIEFKNGSRIDLLDLKFLPSDPLYERFGSTEYTDGAIEEAGEVNSLAFEVLKSRIGRHLNKELGVKATIAVTGNPKKNWTYSTFYKPYKAGTLPNNITFIQSLYSDNPFTAEDYGKQLASIADKQMKERLMKGNWEYDDDPNCLMNYDALIDLFTNTVEESNEKYLTADIARYGQDKTIVRLWKGWKCYKTIIWEKQGIDITIQKIKELLSNEQIPYSHAIVDEDGVGGGVVDGLRGIKGFVNNSTALDNPVTHLPENYQNLKTQCYYKFAEQVNNHLIRLEDIPQTEIDLTIEELEIIKSKDLDQEKKLKIISKDEMKEIIGRSPDRADSLMMRMWFDLKPSYNNNVQQFIPQPRFRPGYNKMIH